MLENKLLILEFFYFYSTPHHEGPHPAVTLSNRQKVSVPWIFPNVGQFFPTPQGGTGENTRTTPAHREKIPHTLVLYNAAEPPFI